MFDDNNDESIQYNQLSGETSVGINGKIIKIGKYKTRKEAYIAARQYLDKLQAK